MSATDAASGGLVPNAYANAFVPGPPREGFQRIQTRLHKARILTDELADYFGARRELEANYLKSLQKIAKRSFLSDPSALGANFLPVYERLVAEIGELARIHGELEKKLEVECEAPMRNASTKGEWARIKEHDDNLSATLKEVATLEQQLAKDQKKVEGASAKKAVQAQQKVTETERALRQTMELWETEAQFSFEGYQRIDAQRLELMKEIVTKFETAQSDAAQQAMQMTEQSMQVALNFDPQADMQEFTLRNATAQGALGRSSRPRNDRPGDINTPRNTGSAAVPSVVAPSAASTVPSNAAQQSNGVNEFGRPLAQQSSASIHSFERQADQAQPQTSTPSKTLGGSTLKSALTRFGRGRSNRNVTNDSGQQYGTLPEQASAMPPPSEAGRAREPDSAIRRSTDEGANASAVSGSLMAPMTPKAATSSSMPPIRSTPPQVDAEGFSIPPANRDRKPWEIGNVNVPSPSIMDDEMAESLDAGLTQKMTGMSIAQKPIQEDEASDQAALERMRSTLLTARSPAMQPPQRRNTTRRDRRDVRNTTYNPLMDDSSRPMSTFGLPNANGGNASTSLANASPFVTSPGFGPERSQSMVSSDSASNVGNATLDSIAAGAPIESGLNAQITERVNVVLNGRNVTKIMVVGELSVSTKDVQALAPVHLRIDAFEQLEKAAPNPQFLTEIAGQPGEYTMDLPAIVRQSGAASSSTTTNKGRVTLLKYQVHVPAHRSNEFVPLHVVPQWRCEDAQTSILINYSGNQDSRVAQTSSDASINEVSMSVDVSSSSVTNVMSKPTAVYSAEQKKLFWRLAEPVVVGGESAAHKALARFQVDAKSDVRPIEVRWKLSGQSLSTLGVSLVNAGEMSFGTITRQLVSGKYTANP